MENELRQEKEWICGIRVITSLDPVHKYLIPKEVAQNKSPHFEKCYYWLFWYFYKIRKCDRCGKPACGKGLIRYMDQKKEKTLAYLCPDCAKRIPEIKNKARKYCVKCNRSCIIHKAI